MMPAPRPTARPQALPHVIRTVVDIAAPPARVFEALTDPRELARWWGGDGTADCDCAADARPGGAWHVRTIERDGTERCVGGEFRVVDAPHRLEQSWRADDDASTSVVRYDLEPLDVDGAEGTRLTVTHTSPTALAASASPAMWASTLSILRGPTGATLRVAAPSRATPRAPMTTRRTPVAV